MAKRGRPPKAQTQSALELDEMSREMQLERYHKNNYTSGTQSNPWHQPTDIPVIVPVNRDVYQALRAEATRERREVVDHIAWLLCLLYLPPAMTSCSRVHDVVAAHAQKGGK